MKITVNEARSSYKIFKIGPVKVRLEEPFGNNYGVKIPFVTEVPLKSGGDAWDRDTYVTKDILSGNKLVNLLKEQYRTIIGTALFNANYNEIAKDKYNFSTFAKWEEEMLADNVNIEALKAEIRKRLEGFKGGAASEAKIAESFKTTKIGNQVWMAENLAIDDGGEGIYQHNGQTYYTWDAAMRVAKSLNGWHLPTKAEFGVLCTAAMDDRSGAGRVLKSVDGWRNGYSTDRFGFSALPAGFRDKGGNYCDEGHYAYFWSSTERSGDSAYVMYMPDYDDDAILNSGYPKNLGFSVRCIKD